MISTKLSEIKNIGIGTVPENFTRVTMDGLALNVSFPYQLDKGAIRSDLDIHPHLHYDAH